MNTMSFGKPYIMQTLGCIHDGWLVLSSRKDNVDSDYFFICYVLMLCIQSLSV
jgi:type I restriction enzyme, S subunit